MIETVKQICVNCGESANSQVKDDMYCCDCFSELFEICESCCEIQNKDDCLWSEINNCYYCEPCFDDCTSFCEDCDSQVDNDDIEKGLCTSCFNDKYILCECCGSAVLAEESYNNCNDNGYCLDCYCEIYCACENCDDEILNDDAILTNNGAYCLNCVPSADFNIIDLDMNWVGKNSYTLIKSECKFGVELETSEIDENNMDWVKLIGWGVCPDGSISGAEFVSPPLYGDDGFSSIKEACDNLIHFNIDSNCGYHLHIELSGTNASQRKSIDLAYHFSKDVWAKFIDPTRVNGAYNEFNSKNLSDILASDDYTAAIGRNHWINWHAFTKFGTLEIRAHEATLCYTAITNWIKAHSRFIDYVKTIHWSNIPLVLQGTDKILEKFFHIWRDDELYNYYMNKGGFPEKKRLYWF